MSSDHDTPSEGTTFPPVTGERIESWLKAKELTYFRDSDGDIGVLIQSTVCYFFLLDSDHQILQIRARWHRSGSIERIGEFLTICNRWNLARTWPKVYVRVNDDGQVVVFAETSFDVFEGGYDVQLADWLETGLQLALNFFAELDEQFPDPILSAS